MNCFKRPVFIRVQRKEGDSNPRTALGGYTLSRRASSPHNSPIINHLKNKSVLIAVYLRFFLLNSILTRFLKRCYFK